MAPHKNFEAILANIQGLCCDFREHTSHSRPGATRHTNQMIAHEFERIRTVTDRSAANEMANRLGALLLD